ncbi:phage shock protein A [Luminiphilus syltensis NOR5-1B]|uniref:Phage shock protein A n=1 Tax=Luminiphilus syltensis NOR5-1B TaxID=565045 RepID=B8KRJ5_9GAMM|nr:phage shock protein PspA [Luminiphilus syltensis]EED35253.1 phage shock protein A [Luminiphilus syltensis NOR5-1B]
MGIFSRMSDIVNSNLNALLDSAEDPEKMIRLIIQEMEDTLVEVRSSSARVLADRKTAARRLEATEAEAAQWEAKAKLAISKGREDLARAALQEKRAIEEEVAAVQEELSATDEHIAQLNEEVSQLQAKLNDAKAKQKTILMRSKTVQSRMQVKRQVHRTELDEAFTKFDKFERRVDNLEGQLEAMDLGRDVTPDLAAEIESLAQDEWLTEELDRLKASMASKDDKATSKGKSSGGAKD